MAGRGLKGGTQPPLSISGILFLSLGWVEIEEVVGAGLSERIGIVLNFVVVVVGGG